MAVSYKNILITPNIGNTADPQIVFSGANSSANTDIYLRVYPDSLGTLSFEGSAGQLFSITNDLSNSIFTVSDVSGIPMFDINFVELPDETDDTAWRNAVLEKTGAVDVVWTGNEWTAKCFEGIVPVKPIKEVPGISSTEIRTMMKNGDLGWKKKVPEDVAMYIGEIDGSERVKALE